MKETTMKKTAKEAKLWQLILFPMNDIATNIIMMLMVFVSYLYTGAIGSSVVFISSFLTGMRAFDAITDPIIGVIIDRTNMKIGKFRPMILCGYVLIAISLRGMYFVAPGMPEAARRPLFVVMYLIYIIGYTFQTACTKAGQTCITNDQEKRPIVTRADAIGNLFVFALIPIYTSNYIAPKYGGFTVQAMQEFCITALLVAGVFTCMSLAALWSRDIPENWGDPSNTEKLKLKDYLNIIKGNRPLQMLIASAASDKLAMQCAGNSSITIMIFGIIIGNYALNGTMSVLTILPNLVIISLGTEYAKRHGSKKTMQVFTVGCMITYGALLILFCLGTPTEISFSSLNFMTIAFVVLYCVAMGCRNVSSSMAIPMIADCTDYETCKSGFYAPGIIGTIFSFVDKLVSSLATSIVGFPLAVIGYTSALPQPGDSMSSGIFAVAMITFIGIPYIGWIINLIALHFYELDGEKMKEIQLKLSEMKEK